MNKRKADGEALSSTYQGSPKRNKRSSFEKSSSDDEEIKENLYGTSDQPGPLSTSFEKIRLLSMESEPEQLPRTVQMSSAPCTPAKKSYSINRKSGSLQPDETSTVNDQHLNRQKSVEIIDEPKEFHRVPGKLSDVRNFLIHAKNVNWLKPKNAFIELNGARLCGFFDNIDIDDHCEIKDRPEERCISYKFNDDLPEMTTCCKYKDGRYAIWRDDPKREELYIVHVTKDDHFPSIQVIGDRMEHILYHLAKKDHVLLKKLLPKEYTFSKIYREVHDALRQRNREKLGDVPTGVGIWIPQEEGQKHIEIGHGAELKKVITQIGEDMKLHCVRAEDQMFEVYAAVELANDEGFFGMGLELGHWLWLANYQCFMEKAKEYLIAAYTYLGRDDFINIVKQRYSQKEDAWKKDEFYRVPAHLRTPVVSVKDCGPKYLTRGQMKNLQ